MLKLLAVGTMVLALSGCGVLERVINSETYLKFCEWAPVAVAAIEAAAVESSKDAAKAYVADALGKAATYIDLSAAQCPKKV